MLTPKQRAEKKAAEALVKAAQQAVEAAQQAAQQAARQAALVIEQAAQLAVQQAAQQAAQVAAQQQAQAVQAAQAAQQAAQQVTQQAAQQAAQAGQQAAQALAVVPCPVPTAEEIEAERVTKKYEEYAKNGHVVQRHGEEITQQQLIDRAVRGIDPASGTTGDAYNKFDDGTPKEHNYGRNATKFATKAAMVKADEAIRNGAAFKQKVIDAEAAGANVVAVTDTKLQDVFGADYKTKVAGVTREGSKKNPTGNTTPADFTDGTIRAIYKKDGAGNWNIETMFPDPLV